MRKSQFHELYGLRLIAVSWARCFVCSSGCTASFPSISCSLGGQMRIYIRKSSSGFSLGKVVVWFGDHEVNFGKPSQGQNEYWRVESVWNERVLRAKPSQFRLGKKQVCFPWVAYGRMTVGSVYLLYTLLLSAVMQPVEQDKPGLCFGHCPWGCFFNPRRFENCFCFCIHGWGVGGKDSFRISGNLHVFQV